jgi:hypothetical protein
MGEYISAGVAILGFIGTIFNVWLTAKMRADLAELKVWTLENFVSKADNRSQIQTYLSQERTMQHNA